MHNCSVAPCTYNVIAQSDFKPVTQFEFCLPKKSNLRVNQTAEKLAKNCVFGTVIQNKCAGLVKCGFHWTFHSEVLVHATSQYTCGELDHICSRIAQATCMHRIQKCMAENFLIESATQLASITCNADHSGTHGTQNITISNNVYMLHGT